MQNTSRILVVRTDRIGDVILTFPMVELLRRNFPSAHIAMLIRRYTRELVEDNPHLNEIICYDDGSKPIPFFQLAATLRRGRFDVAFVTYPRFRLAVLLWWTGIPVRIGSGYRWYSFFFNRKVYVHRKTAERHEAEYNIDLLASVGLTVDEIPLPRLNVAPSVEDSLRHRLRDFGITPDQRYVILHPGTGGSARTWSAAKFSELGKKLAEELHVRILVVGGRGEDRLVASVARGIGVDAISLVDWLSLREYAALAKSASLFVSNSTGPIHIAAAVGTPVIGLYPHMPPMSPSRWAPMTERKIVIVPNNRPSNCRECVRRADASGVCECMETITVEEVYKAAQSILQVETPHSQPHHASP